ncbi:RNA polymerase RpoE-like sigma-24 subunit [Paenibacillus sp. VMFN-D1]|nr:RNA polymerase RpoE-like sigma-24 subunit [Paenibacillus sp. VMFN-D1]
MPRHAASNLTYREEGRRLEEELQWIRAVKAGHPEAYKFLVQRYQSMVYHVCLKMTADSVSAKDLSQDIFLKAYSALPAFREESSFSTWLYQIAVRKCLDWKRAHQREQARRTMGEVNENDWVTAETPEKIVLSEETNSRIRQIVDELQEPYKSAVQMYYFEQCSYQEIAKRRGITAKTVESQLYRARQMMRQKGEELR